MKKILFHLFLMLFWALTIPGYAGQHPDRVTQISTLNALLAGIYDGHVTIHQLKGYGNFGLGTFNGLDGEMVFVDGHVYQVPYNGHPLEPSDSTGIPFAVVTFFNTDKTFTLTPGMDYPGLKTFLKPLLPTRNIFYAVKITGLFKSVTTRSVKRQHRPFPPLKDVVKDEAIFHIKDVEGTIVGFISPPWIQGINVPGYHLHFINKQKNAGGHVLKFQVEHAVLEVDSISELSILLPHNPDFYKADLAHSQAATIRNVER